MMFEMLILWQEEVASRIEPITKKMGYRDIKAQLQRSEALA
jgi:hypothetical protein